MSDEYADVSGKVSHLFFAGGNQSYVARVEDSIARLSQIQDRLETELSERCAGFRREVERSDFSVSDIAHALPKEGALLEYIKFRPYSFAASPYSKNYGKAVYGAFVLDNEARVNFVNLGDARAIDSLVGACRDNLERAGREVYAGKEAAVTDDLSNITGKLYAKVLAPVEKFLEGRDQILICPSGQLSLIPFDILSTPDSKYLIEKYKVSYLSSGRNLLEYARPALEALENELGIGFAATGRSKRHIVLLGMYGAASALIDNFQLDNNWAPRVGATYDPTGSGRS